MGAKTMTIQELVRVPESGPEERLAFTPGVNVIVGPPNTGKTKWLAMLDYLLGDRDKPENAFGSDLVEKYRSARATLKVGDRSIQIERRWKEPGLLTKVLVDGQTVSVDDFSVYMLQSLNVPVLHYPQGNPYGDRAWKMLGFRSLYRHIYRRQDSWGDIADRQPDSEQYACLMLFQGLGQRLFSEEYGDLVKKQKEIMRLQGAREGFVQMLQQVSKEIVRQEGLSVALTPESLSWAISRVKAKIEKAQQDRGALLQSLLDTTVATDPSQEMASRERFERLSEDLTELRRQREESELRHSRTKDRLAEMHKYRQTVEEELARVKRANAGGAAFAGLRVTHCPACDQAVGHENSDTDICYVCRQLLPRRPTNDGEMQQRLKFELEQLQGELQEADELIEKLSSDLTRERSVLDGIGERITAIRTMLRPFQHAAATVLPPDMALLDVETGRLQEELAQLERVLRALGRRERVSRQIGEIEKDAARLEADVARQKAGLNYEKAADQLADGMNTYLNEINQLRPGSWPSAEVRVRFIERRFYITVGGDHWRSKLGGTLRLYFLFAYHYALLRLTTSVDCYYPGVALLDILAEIEGVSVADKENFVLEPFINLLKADGMEGSQVIASGAAFEDLGAAKRIELTKVWV